MQACQALRNKFSLGRLGEWLRAHDPGYAALRRAARAAILMPALFALGDKVIANPEMSYFIAFGSFAMLLLVDFGGSRLDRLRSQALLGVACAVMICLGTLVSHSTALAAIGMFIVAFVVLFSGVVSSVIASATTPLLLAFILPVTVPGPVSQIPDRVAGWGIAAAVSLVAITVLWPSAVAFPIEARAIAACRALAARIRAEIAWVLGGGGASCERAYREAARARRRRGGGAGQAVPRDALPADRAEHQGPRRDPARRRAALAERRRARGRALKRRRVPPDQVDLRRQARRRRGARPRRRRRSTRRRRRRRPPRASSPRRASGCATALRAARGARPPACRSAERAAAGRPAESPATVVSALDPSFRAQELAYITEQVAANVDFAAAAGRRTWLQRLLGRQPAGFTGPLELRQGAGAAPTPSRARRGCTTACAAPPAWRWRCSSPT